MSDIYLKALHAIEDLPFDYKVGVVVDPETREPLRDLTAGALHYALFHAEISGVQVLELLAKQRLLRPTAGEL